MDDLLADFLVETGEAVAEADQALLRLERAPGDQATLSLILRLVHTIKGTCGLLGLPRLERMTHLTESVLGHVRDDALAVTPDLVTGILRALNQVKVIVAGLAATGAEPAGDDAGVIAALEALAEGAAPEIANPVAGDAFDADGAGWTKLPRLMRALLQRGLATEAELAAMTDAQIQALIFRAGLSTATTVKTASRRGVGTDVVRTNVERIGHGTTFTTRLPTTLAIVPALIVEASGRRFAIPRASVVELVQACSSRAGGCERIDGTPAPRLLPLVRLSDLLRLPRAGRTGMRACIVVTATGAGAVGIMVDQVLGTEDAVVKPVAPMLRHATMFSGSTTLGDGTVVMILDPNGAGRAAAVGAEPQARPPADRAA